MWCLYGFIKNLPETGEMIHGFVEYSLVSYWDELKKVLRAFGDSCKDFDIPEGSEVASELIKEGFTLEFMKNAVIRPLLSLKNPQLLLDWWRKVEGGDGGATPPPEGEVFKSDHYSSFIFLFFKIGTEVNVFSHLGKKLFTHMKEAMFSDVPEVEESDSEDEEVGEETDEVKDTPEVEKVETEAVNGEGSENGGVAGGAEEAKSVSETEVETGNSWAISGSESTVTKAAETDHGISPDPAQATGEKVVTSMYGKVYKLKSNPLDPL